MNLLAFDTATEQMSVALRVGDEVLSVEGAGGAQASATLLPAISALLAQAGVRLRDLDAIAFGRGPGAFTGLRTACAVAQGLAFGAGTPVLPIDTLLALAESARAGRSTAAPSTAAPSTAAPSTAAPSNAARSNVVGEPATGPVGDFSVWALLDARMDQIYAAHYRHRAAANGWQTLAAPMLTDAEALARRWQAEPPAAIAGSALTTLADRLRPGAAQRFPAAAPTAVALLPLATALWQAGGAVDPALALPLYVRDKVAQTTLERAATHAARAAPPASAGAAR